MSNNDAFTFAEINDNRDDGLPDPLFFDASDGIKLAYYQVLADKPVASLLFIHGGGAYAGAGYQHLARGLSENYGMSAYLIDLRGHGNSEGIRGGAPGQEQVFRDITIMLDIIKSNNPGIPLFLGGHSSGGGLILNYITRHNDPDISGYVFISPEFGYKSGTRRPNIAVPFVRVNMLPFVFFGMSGGRLCGNTRAVYFNYPESIIKRKPLLIKSITCNMAMALTPDKPGEQFAGLKKPFGLFIGRNDELFDPEKLIQYAGLAEEGIRNRSAYRILEDEGHLSVLKNADKLIGDTILKIIGNG
jgi:pimeloyl-ACP methyl ester carboxylesterase